MTISTGDSGIAVWLLLERPQTHLVVEPAILVLVRIFCVAHSPSQQIFYTCSKGYHKTTMPWAIATISRKESYNDGDPNATGCCRTFNYNYTRTVTQPQQRGHRRSFRIYPGQAGDNN